MPKFTAEEREIEALIFVKQVACMFKAGEDQYGEPFAPDVSDWQETLERLIGEAREIVS